MGQTAGDGGAQVCELVGDLQTADRQAYPADSQIYTADRQAYIADSQLKSVGPKLVPFFKTVAIFFVLFGLEEKQSIFFCIIKCLPVVSLIVFVLLHGMSFDECYRYSRRILVGLIFSVIGDAFLVWKHSYMNLEMGLLCFAVAQTSYARAFGWRPFKPYAGSVFVLIGLCTGTCSLT
ncbi:Lysoplasmalogenase-like protein tmem86a [Bulinus truncatus]|nr:Lysoplasmalogenase-like protein tmem86a [Bulinus truncatus]